MQHKLADIKKQRWVKHNNLSFREQCKFLTCLVRKLTLVTNTNGIPSSRGVAKGVVLGVKTPPMK
jgi:hypothetical protein